MVYLIFFPMLVSFHERAAVRCVGVGAVKCDVIRNPCYPQCVGDGLWSNLEIMHAIQMGTGVMQGKSKMKKKE